MDDRAAVIAANECFYLAFERRDLAAMAACWSGTDGDACIHPGWEPVYGNEAVMETWEGIFETGVPMHFSVSDIVVQLLGDIARVHNVENISVAGEGETIGRVAVTHLYLRRAGQWQMVLHHGSPIAPFGEPAFRAEETEFH